jgi:hypothetical protein
MRRVPVLAVLWVACACAPRGPSYTSLHVVDGEVVYSTPPPTSAYASYLRCRLALEATPPRLDEAAGFIEAAIAADPRDPQLWTVRGEIAARRGDGDRAMASVKRALELADGYPPAKQLEARLGKSDAVAGQ